MWRAHSCVAASATGFPYGPAYRGTRPPVLDSHRQHSCEHLLFFHLIHIHIQIVPDPETIHPIGMKLALR